MGLGTGVKIVFHPSLFESAIERHGQYIRWYSSAPCTCINGLSQPDPECSRCLGRGYEYFSIKEKRIIEDIFSTGGDTISVVHDIQSIISLKRCTGEDVLYTSFDGKSILLPGTTEKYSYYQIDYIYKLEHPSICSAQYLGKGLLRINIPGTITPEGEFVGTITEITRLYNTTKQNNIGILSFWEDRVLTNDYLDLSDIIEVTCKYLEPMKFLITNVGALNRFSPGAKGTSASLSALQEYDAVATFSGFLSVGSGDLITLLRAEQKTSAIGHLTSGNIYRVPFYHIRSLVDVRDEIGKIDDVILVNENELRFDGRIPKKQFSIAFHYNPTFVVSGDSTSLRYGEDKVFPKRAGIKRWESFTSKEIRPVSRLSSAQQTENPF